MSGDNSLYEKKCLLQIPSDSINKIRKTDETIKNGRTIDAAFMGT